MTGAGGGAAGELGIEGDVEDKAGGGFEELVSNAGSVDGGAGPDQAPGLPFSMFGALVADWKESTQVLPAPGLAHSPTIVLEAWHEDLDSSTHSGLDPDGPTSVGVP